MTYFEKASKEKLIVYSSGANGVDSVSEITALNLGSAVVSFVADSLLSKIKRQDCFEQLDLFGNKACDFEDARKHKCPYGWIVCAMIS